jgi:hypothetical protein
MVIQIGCAGEGQVSDRLQKNFGERLKCGEHRCRRHNQAGPASPNSRSDCYSLRFRSFALINSFRRRIATTQCIADNLSKAGWTWGCVSAVDSNGRTIFIADAHRGDGKRFIVRADEKLTAFVELESAIRVSGELS